MIRHLSLMKSARRLLHQSMVTFLIFVPLFMQQFRSRDLSLVEKIECSQDGTITFACTSVESPRLPKVPGRVRAQVKVGDWIHER